MKTSSEGWLFASHHAVSHLVRELEMELPEDVQFDTVSYGNGASRQRLSRRKPYPIFGYQLFILQKPSTQAASGQYDASFATKLSYVVAAFVYCYLQWHAERDSPNMYLSMFSCPKGRHELRLPSKLLAKLAGETSCGAIDIPAQGRLW